MCNKWPKKSSNNSISLFKLRFLKLRFLWSLFFPAVHSFIASEYSSRVIIADCEGFASQPVSWWKPLVMLAKTLFNQPRKTSCLLCALKNHSDVGQIPSWSWVFSWKASKREDSNGIFDFSLPCSSDGKSMGNLSNLTQSFYHRPTLLEFAYKVVVRTFLGRIPYRFYLIANYIMRTVTRPKDTQENVASSQQIEIYVN